jgi:multiple sugar transport system permease protein
MSALGERRARRGEAPRRGSEGRAAFLFLLPNAAGFLALTFFPVLAAFALSLTRWQITGTPSYVGATNFAAILGFHREGHRLAASDPEFWRYLYNTVFLMAGIPIGMVLSLLLALLLNQRLKGVVFFRTLFFLPQVCSAVAVALLWKWILEPDVGLLNSGLRSFGIANPPAWLLSTQWAKPAFIMMALWMTVGGYNCVLYLAGLQGIPAELYEAADIDGAGAWRKLRHITWPMLSPTTFFILVISLIAGFQGGFIAAFMMTDGGPAGATTTLMFYIYQRAFRWFEMGYASALAVILFLLVFGLTLINWHAGKRVVHYQ